MKQGFSKRVFTARLFFKYLGFLIGNALKILRVYTQKENKQLVGKIVLVTDAVNGCIYCSWLDAKLAVKEGIGEQEITNLLKLQYHEEVSEEERGALLFAQHYAQSNGNPDPEMVQRLFERYGYEHAEEIVIAIKAVTFGNLYFNTWRAVISRFRGDPAPNSNVVFELLYFLLNTPIILPFVIVRALDKNALGRGIVEE